MSKKGYPKHLFEPFDSIYDGVRKQAQRYGDKPRYIYKKNKVDVSFSYNDMLTHTNYVASAIEKLGLVGTNIIVTGETHPSYVATYFGTVASGSTIVPLDKDIKSEQMANFSEICETSIFVFSPVVTPKVKEILPQLKSVKHIVAIDGDETTVIDDERYMTFEQFLEIGKNYYDEGHHTAEEYQEVKDMEKCCAIIFTSGTTGTSKGVMLSQKNITTNGYLCGQMLYYRTEDRFVTVLPIHHTYEMTTMQIACPNYGMTMYINDSLKNVVPNLKHFKPTGLTLVPLFVETMYKKVWAEIDRKGKRKLVKRMMKISNFLRKFGIDMRRVFFKDILAAFGGELRSIVCGGAPLRPELVKDMSAFGIEIYEGYGITECSPLVAANVKTWRKLHSVGLVVPGVDVKIDKVNESDEAGEILVKGDIVMMGYYKNPEATAAAFTEDGYFRTGDLGYLDEDKFLFITGRKKNLIILSNGKNIYPEEIEEYLGVHEIIKECVVVGKKKNPTDEELSIIALIHPDYDLLKDKTPEEIEALIAEAVKQTNLKLPSFKRLGGFEIRETEFEKNTSKKIMRYKIQ